MVLQLSQKHGAGEVPSAVPNFTPIREYLGFPAPKKRKIAKIANLLAILASVRPMR